MNTDAPWPDARTARQWVLKIQTKLHQWATDDPGRRFDDLWNLVYDPAVLVEAWHRVRSNRGARTAGVDGETAYYVMTVRGEQAFLSESMQMWEVFVGRFFDRIEIFRSQAAALLWLQPKPKVRPMLTQH